jgi:hypothetical protein
VANIARVTAILERSNNPNLRQALRYAQRAWIQLDQQNPVSAVGEEHVGKSRSQPISRTAGGRPRTQRSNNNDNAQESGHLREAAATSRRHPRQPNHRNPPEDLCQKMNEGRDARSIIDSRRREREVADTEGTDCSDHFPAFTARFSSFKLGITKYDGKQAPQQWLRCYSTAIEVAGGSNITKIVYFPMALDGSSTQQSAFSEYYQGNCSGSSSATGELKPIL